MWDFVNINAKEDKNKVNNNSINKQIRDLFDIRFKN